LPETQAFRRAADVLKRIVGSKWSEVERLLPEADRVAGAASQAPPARDLAAALQRPGEVAVIAEVKRRSPGAGPIRPELDPGALGAGYRARGAAAVSVLTDREWFGGSPSDLRAVRERVDIPVLRKDFVLHEVQVAEARAMGADAVLLIVRILEQERLTRLLEAAEGWGMAALVEVHDGEELERALHAGARLLGINNRDLATFTTDLEVTLGLLPSVPRGVPVVSESGIRTRADVERLGEEGVHAVLVGESLLRAPDPPRALAELVGCARGDRSLA